MMNWICPKGFRAATGTKASSANLRHGENGDDSAAASPFGSPPSRSGFCPAAHCSLLTAYCSLLTALGALPHGRASAPLPTAHCSLLTAYCLLLTAYCSLLTASAPSRGARCGLINLLLCSSQ